MKRIIWAILAISLLANAYLLFSWYQHNYVDGKSLKIQNEELADLLSMANIKSDSLQIKLDETLREYESLINESIDIKSERDQALHELEEKKIKIRQLIYRASQGDPQALLEANRRIKALEGELGAARGQIEAFNGIKTELEDEINSTRMKQQDAERVRDAVIDEHTELQEKVKKTKFQVSQLTLKPIRLKRNKEVETYKASKIDHIQMEFVLDPNELIEKGTKIIAVRILGVSGEVLGAGNEDLQDSDKLISMKKEIDYSGDQHAISFKFKQDEAYKKGVHTVEVLGDGKLLTRNSFRLE